MYDYSEVATSEKFPCGEKKLTALAINENCYKKVSLQYKDGRFLKGYTNDFFPNISLFHLLKLSDKSIDKGTTIYLDDLKIIFFDENIKADNPPEIKHLPDSKGTSGDKLEIQFKDGEIFTGTMIDCRPNSFGFFLLMDHIDMPMRVFAISSAMKKVRSLQ